MPSSPIVIGAWHVGSDDRCHEPSKGCADAPVAKSTNVRPSSRFDQAIDFTNIAVCSGGMPNLRLYRFDHLVESQPILRLKIRNRTAFDKGVRQSDAGEPRG